MNQVPRDQFGRRIQDLRISVTDRCNFRCTYCMPKAVFGRDFEFLPRHELLSFEEITRLARICTWLGVQKVRITGGEPLLRRDLPVLIKMLAELEGIEDLTLTTNGSVLSSLAKPLRDAGLRRISVSLDSLDEAVFAAMNDVGFPVGRVVEGIEAAMEVGFSPMKINMVVKRGVNEESILPMARRFRRTGCIVRFIEYMDVGNTNGWRLDDVVSGAEIATRIDGEFPLEPVVANYAGEVAARYRYRDGSGEIGIISSVTQPFCSGCSRARLSSKGELYTCLFGSTGYDLRPMLRGGAAAEEIAHRIGGIWQARSDRYSELRSALTKPGRKIEMSRIGG